MGIFDDAQGVARDDYGIKVDMILCIDATVSMSPVIGTVKNLASNLYDNIRDALRNTSRPIDSMRIKAIVFRDYYVEGALDDLCKKEKMDQRFAMQESKFFNMPDEKYEFQNFIENIEAEGGGDEPENALEAMALAFKALHTEGVQKRLPSDKIRHMVVVFTDASAHPLEFSKKGKPDVYPDDMPDSLDTMKELWSNVCQRMVFDDYNMDLNAERLVLFVPTDLYPWNEIAGSSPWAMTQTESIAPAMGGSDLSADAIVRLLINSV